MKKKFKNLDWCESHKKYYHWSCGCGECKKTKSPMKKLDLVLKEMEQEGLIPKNKDDKNNTVGN